MLLRAIAGLIEIDVGTIDVLGARITGRDTFPENMGFLIEPMKPWSDLTAAENLRLLASIREIIGNRFRLSRRFHLTHLAKPKLDGSDHCDDGRS